jgi:eukaryotic-like serine/threonine-protein kinase
MGFCGMSNDRESQASTRVGQTLRGKWKLERLIGVGGMASVYAAVHRNGMRGAVKMLHPDMAALGDARNRFLREGYVANAVDHDGVVKVLDDDVTDDGTVFLVMELLDGASIEALAAPRQGRLRLAEVAAVGDQLLDVLVASHAKGIWHRDLKPENLFLTRSGQLKVLDFGIAKMRQGSFEGASATTTGSVIGSPAFMPPEQALGRWKIVDGRSDLFAVGASLFTLLSGRAVHPGETLTEVLVAAATQPVAPTRSIDPSIPAPVAAVLDCAMAFDIEARFPDASSMRQALLAAAGLGDVSGLVDQLEATEVRPAARPSVTSQVAAPPAPAVPAPTAYLPPTPAAAAVAQSGHGSASWSMPAAASQMPYAQSVVEPRRRSFGVWVVVAAAVVVFAGGVAALAMLAGGSQLPSSSAPAAPESAETPATASAATPRSASDGEPAQPSVTAEPSSTEASSAARPTASGAPPPPRGTSAVSSKPPGSATSKMFKDW